MKYYIEIGTVNKAKRDIDAICQEEGYENLTRQNFGNGGVGRFLTKLVSVSSVFFRLHRNDVLFLQYPMKKFYWLACTLAHWRGAKVVTVIHDLGAFRRHKLTPEQENHRLSKTDFLIVHNPTMRDYLLEHGYQVGIHCLQIFDYLSPAAPRLAPAGKQPWQLVYAGNLGRWRNAFLYHLTDEMDGWQLDLYGKGFDDNENHNPQLHYHGFKQSDDFIAGVEAHFGIVWDGDAIDRCTGDWGEYLKINDPHKTSFYLRAGIPVIVWKQAAMAPFILEEKVGLAVDSLGDISRVLSQLSAEAYEEIRQHAVAMGRRLAAGYYVRQGMQAADAYLNK